MEKKYSKYFKELLEINKEIMQEEDDKNVRVEEQEKENVERLLANFYSTEFDLDKFIKLCTILFNMQIFYDGNSRTIFTYLATVIEKNGYYIDFEKAANSLLELRNFFPIMYDLNEEINNNMFNRIKQHIIKKESKGIKK